MINKKKIIFDAQILQTPALNRGMGQYILALLKEISRETSQTNQELIVLLTSNEQISKDLEEEIKKLDTKVKIVQLPLAVAIEETNTSKQMDDNKIILNDWIAKESLAGAAFIIGSLFQAQIFPVFPQNVLKMAILYDVIPIQFFKQYKDKMPWSDYLTRFSELYAADKLFCISKSVADEAQLYASISPDKLAVINGAPGTFDKFTKPKHIPTKKFILMPTGNDWRKNNKNAVIGFENYRLVHNPELTLVVTSYFNNIEMQELQKLSPEIKFTGSINNEELAWYYAHCEALLFPSLHEGLGMPLLEAMMFDKPIAASGIDVFLEISKDLPYFFNPTNPESITAVLVSLFDDSNFEFRRSRYCQVLDVYTWENAAKVIMQSVVDAKIVPSPNKLPRVAIVGPYQSGVSAIGKLMGVLHPQLIQRFNVDYFLEASPADIELRPDVISHIANCKPISSLTNEVALQYDIIIYHVGNSNHHTLTAARALLVPGIVIFHDLNLENVYGDFVKRRFIDSGRYELEVKLNEGTKAKFIYSIAARQKGVIVHSNYAKLAIKEFIDQKKIMHAQLAVDTPEYYENSPREVFTIGLAGILANIKGLETIEKIARDESFKYDRILVFGLNFAKKSDLVRLRSLPNVEIATNLTDYEFQENLKRMSVFVNYRTIYQGEASYSTLETMRYGIPVIVRSDFGWYSELPEDSVVKVNSESELIPILKKLKSQPDYMAKLSKNAHKTTKEDFSPRQYVDTLEKLMEII